MTPTFKKTRQYILCAFLFATTGSHAQSYTGITAGAGLSRLYDLQRDDSSPNGHTEKYSMGPGLQLSAFYQEKVDSMTLRIDLQYAYQNAGLDVFINQGHSGYSTRKLDFSFHQVNFALIFPLKLKDAENFKLNFLIGPMASGTLSSFTTGGGTNYSEGKPDSTNTEPFLENWVIKDGRNHVARVNFGFLLGLEFGIPISEKMDFLFQNRYNLFTTNMVNFSNVNWTSLVSGYLNMGLRYKIK